MRAMLLDTLGCHGICAIVLTYEGGEPLLLKYKVSSPRHILTLPKVDHGSYQYVVDWGDGTMSEHNAYSHVYKTMEVFTVTVTGMFHGFQMEKRDINDCSHLCACAFCGCGRTECETCGNCSCFFDSKMMLLSVDSWGDNCSLSPAKDGYYFSCCSALQHIAVPDLTGVTSLCGMFECASKFDGDVSGWDVSNITNMSHMFHSTRAFSGKGMHTWVTLGVRTMEMMFYNAKKFNGDISCWNVGEVMDMSYMFEGATVFDKDIKHWDISKVETMIGIFFSADAFYRTHADDGHWGMDVSKPYGWDSFGDPLFLGSTLMKKKTFFFLI